LGFLKFVHVCFEQKRKTLRNNLRSAFSDEQVEAVLSSNRLSRNIRAEQLSLSQFAGLFRQLRTV
jgi:16S rRNA (adenine1518-N6/adenine1519-N6)-dimethyltransferase